MTIWIPDQPPSLARAVGVNLCAVPFGTDTVPSSDILLSQSKICYVALTSLVKVKLSPPHTVAVVLGLWIS